MYANLNPLPGELGCESEHHARSIWTRLLLVTSQLGQLDQSAKVSVFPEAVQRTTVEPRNVSMNRIQRVSSGHTFGVIASNAGIGKHWGCYGAQDAMALAWWLPSWKKSVLDLSHHSINRYCRLRSARAPASQGLDGQPPGFAALDQHVWHH